MANAVDDPSFVEAAPSVVVRRDRTVAAGLFIALLVVYNVNGREIGSYDSQSTKFAARELLLRGTLRLNHVVGATPEYAERWGYIHAADGHYRSVYSPVPAIAAAAIWWPLWKTRIVDIRAPLAPALMAKLAASALVAAAVVLAFVIARQRVTRGRALLLAIGLGLGTGYWSTASQTLWQTETVAFGLSLALVPFAARRPFLSLRAAAVIGIGLGIAVTARPQLAPVVACLLVGTWIRGGPRNGFLSTVIVSSFVGALCAANMRWFHDPLGALPVLQDVNARVHATGASFRLNAEGFLGLLVSPSRGLLIFSPIVLVAAGGLRQSLSEGWRSPLRWCVVALLAQYVLYSSYAVWWAGHTFGPRYLLDVLPLAVPLASAALQVRVGTVTRLAAAAALAWSVLVAATGAFCYPHDQWNVDPSDIDRNHARLWAVTDSQIARCWKRGVSPQNFHLFQAASIRRAAD